MKRLILLVFLVLLAGCATSRVETHSLVGLVTNVQMMHYDVTKTEPHRKCYELSNGRQNCDIYYVDTYASEYRNYIVEYNANGFTGSIVTYRKFKIGQKIKVDVMLNPR